MSFVLPLAGGVVAALVNIVIVSRLSRRRAAEFFNLFMAATSAFYFGSALAVGNGQTLAIQTAVGAVLFALALAGQWWSLKFTTIAFVAHGVWDLGHVMLGLGANAGQDFPMICVAYDWVIAGYLWWMDSGNRRRELKAATD